MTTFSVSAAGTTDDGSGMFDEMADALIHAADKYSRGLGARTADPSSARHARTSERTDKRGHPAGREPLPAGYIPLAEVKDLALRGWWPLLEDRMSPCMPSKIIAAMQRRSALGDRDADAWLKVHAQACAGDAEAQRAFGRICENGSYRAAADLQRAFFWYYRAGLQGDVEARTNAERLMHRSARICPATMAEPLLIYPGQWRITAHLSGHLRSISVFDLAGDGSATGWLIGNSRQAAGAQPPGYHGGWAFDGIGQVLTVIFESEGGERRWRNANWQIEMLGCRPGSIFARDRRHVGYTLEHLSGSEL
jgi:TPR repeat protein